MISLHDFSIRIDDSQSQNLTAEIAPAMKAITDGLLSHVGGSFGAGVVGAMLVVWLTTRWLRFRQSAVSSMRRNNSSILHMARKSSAASLATLKQVSSSASFARLSEAMKSFQRSRRGCCFEPTISASELFVSLDVVKKMSLDELSVVIDYATKCNQSSFDYASFVAPLSCHVKEVIAATDAAVTKSRGVNVQPSLVSTSSPNGSVDSLYFCAAMRLLVEWRAVKVIPEEYKAYAVGMTVAKRDLVQNTGKVEEAIHHWIEEQVLSGEQEVASPTVRQLLEYELATNAHTRLPKLKDKTAAIGLVWMNRQLQFQTKIFANLLHVPSTYKTTNEAVRAAYKTVFDRYHGWTIQQVFNYSFNGAPPALLLFRLMNPRLVEEIRNYVPDGDTVVVDFTTVPEPVESSFTSSFSDYDDEDMVTCESRDGFDIVKLGRDIQRNWDQFARNVERDWSNFVDHLGGHFGKGRNSRCRSLTEDSELSVAGPLLRRPSDMEPDNVENDRPFLCRRSSVPRFVLNEDALERQVAQETTKAAHNHIFLYLNIMDPLLKDLTTTIDEFGMNDPSRI